MAQCSVIGVITRVNPVESGTSAAGNAWQKQTIVIDKIGTSSPVHVAMEIFGEDKIKALNATIGLAGEFFFDVESRESKPDPVSGATRWFNSISFRKVSPIQMAVGSQPEQRVAPAQSAPQMQPQNGWGQNPQMQPQNNWGNGSGGWTPMSN